MVFYANLQCSLEIWSLLGSVCCVQGAQVCTPGLQFLTVLGCWLLRRDEGAFQAQNIYRGGADASDNTAGISAYLRAVAIGSLPFLLSLWGNHLHPPIYYRHSALNMNSKCNMLDKMEKGDGSSFPTSVKAF